MGMLLTYRPRYWEGAPAEPVEPQPDTAGDGVPTAKPGDGQPDAPADAYDDLTDEQVAEAYATNVGGNATSRKGQVRALRKLDDDSSE